MEGGRRQQRRRVLAPRAVDGGRHARSDGSVDRGGVDRGRIRCGVSARRLQEEKETGRGRRRLESPRRRGPDDSTEATDSFIKQPESHIGMPEQEDAESC